MTAPTEVVKQATSDGVDHKARRRILMLLVLTMVCLLGTVSFAIYNYMSIRDQAERGTTLAQQVREACQDPSQYTDELTTLCDDADSVVDSAPAVLQGPAGEDGEDGEDGQDGRPGATPSPAQIESAVLRYCSGGNCEGESVTAADVQVAVQTYCNARGQCTGPAGSDGSDGSDGVGTDGADGADGAQGAQGAQGPPPSSEQVAASIVSYCSTRNNCQGPQGPAGRGIVSVACEATEVMSFTITYSDGTSEEITCNPQTETPPTGEPDPENPVEELLP